MMEGRLSSVLQVASLAVQIALLFVQPEGGEFDCSFEKSVDFSVEIYYTKKLNL